MGIPARFTVGRDVSKPGLNLDGMSRPGYAQNIAHILYTLQVAIPGLALWLGQVRLPSEYLSIKLF
jgi:hypothetical protein